MLGSNAQFQVQASGAGTLSYQWQFNGANLLNLGGISGVQTPTLNISNLVTADGGSYQVVISNAFGTLVSTAAVLTVLTPPIGLRAAERGSGRGRQRAASRSRRAGPRLLRINGTRAAACWPGRPIRL